MNISSFQALEANRTSAAAFSCLDIKNTQGRKGWLFNGRVLEKDVQFFRMVLNNQIIHVITIHSRVTIWLFNVANGDIII